ncbi:MAG: trypsin-like peptidase domain-containing protein [Eubacteriales bacterium]|jgi:serine protease Do
MEDIRTPKSQSGEPKSPEGPPKRPALPDEPPESTPENIPEMPPDEAPGSTPQNPTETPPTTGDVVGPEIELPGEHPRPNIELPPRPHGPRIISEGQNTTGQAYRWTYGEESPAENTKRRETGVLTYAIVMTIAFAVCFTLLLGVLLYDRQGNTRTVFVRDLANDSGVLTIPEISEKIRPSVVCITVEYGGIAGISVGTGIIMTEDGYIATNYHVVENGKRITVTAGRNEYPAEVVGYDALSDLAVLKIDATGLTPAEFGDSDSLIVGEPAVAIGTPAGLDYAETVTNGIISAINRNVKIYDRSGVMVKKMTLIQTNATVNPGNSGGPLINEYGQVIGIVTMKLADDFEGIGFAIPINGALAVLNEIIETGSVSNSTQVAQRRAILGIVARGIFEGQSYELDDERTIKAGTTGVIVASVTPGYGAEGKLLPGDIITQVDGNDVISVNEIMDIVNDKSVGDSVLVRFYRDGRYHEVTVQLLPEEP